jgi:predicted 3-demethylubiquinone-9 3-methyltransferase (glyoxalase superfamily)
MAQLQRITPFLWFDTQAEEAVKFYTSVFKDSRIKTTTHYTQAGKENHGKPPGSVMTIDFEIEGQPFTAINGGPQFRFNESVSFVVHCRDQAEIDYYWDKLTPGGDPKAQICGWLKDKYGLSWQVAPDKIMDWLKDPATAERVLAAVMRMKKLNYDELQQAATSREPVRA